MFGNLFEEDEESFSAVPTSGNAAKATDAEPPPPRGSVKLSGIKNQGGTCYLNSLLQTLLFTPEFREELFSLGPEELGSLADKDKPEAKVRVIPLQLQRLFAQLLLVDQQAASTADLTDSFGWSNSEESSQQDVQELNRILFSALESSLVGTPGSSLIHRLYHGNVVNQIVCKECGNTSERQEDFLDLTVSVKGVCGLEEALWNMFVEEEMFEGNNLYRCSRCDHLVTAAKSAKLRKLPPFLTVSLLRFNFDFVKCERYKETGRYSFPLTINLRPFCEQTDRPDSEFTFELFSVIIHKGGCYGGHYHVYIKDIDQLGHWEAPDEESKPKVQKKEVKVSETEVEKEDPLSVLVGILSQEEGKSVLVDQLGQKLLDRIGISWNRKFRKQYGPIGKFLQSHSEVFMLLANGTRVTLKASSPAPPGPEPAPTSPGSAPGSAPERAAEEPEPLPADGGRWFDLNDSTVAPISGKAIEKQFQGKESAYMLFYRRAGLLRPEEAKGNPSYRVPPHLVQLAQEENCQLQQRREEFDASRNTIEVRLHLAPQYQVTNGALQPVGRGQDSVITITFDRRKTVGDLRLAVYQMQDLWEGDMALTVAKSLPAGLHLYNTLSDDQQSLYTAGARDGSDLFVWNGREVGGTSVQTGAEWEPVLLTLVRPSLEEEEEEEEEAEGGVAAERGGGDAGGAGLRRTERGFAGGTTLGAVREALGPQNTLLCQESRPGCNGDGGGAGAGGGGASGGGGGASGWRVFPAADMHRTLKELALRDGDALLVLEPQALDTSIISVSGDIVTVTTPSDCRWLLVEFSPRGGRGAAGEEEQDERERRRGKVPASGNMLLLEVKQRAMEVLQLQDQLQDVKCCLRQVDSTGRLLPPVCEHLSVREAGVKLMTSLLLCPGEAPGPTQLFLYYTVGSDSPAAAERELTVEETLTVKECLKLIVKLAGLEGEAWHLRKTDWCEEVGDALTEEDATLAELRIHSGDTLVLTEGRLPPKGFLKLPVWLYGLQSDRYVSQEAQGNHVTNGVEGDPAAVTGAEFRFAGQVEISGEASLDDLKTQVMTLPSLQDVCVPAPPFLRVWVLEGRRLSKILRGNQLPLKNLKLGSGTELCVQQLLKEENLGPKELVLRVQMGIPGEQEFYPPEELVWDTSRDSSPRALHHALAAQYGVSPDCLHIAKHLPEKHAWMAISNWSQQVSKRKKKKRAESLQGAPFHLKDGDLIGVKNLLIDSNRDFCTLRDVLGQQRLRQEAESRRKGGPNTRAEPSQEAGPERKVAGKCRKPEVALSINVGVFR
ncbi:ubiquitin carboxyl-terminal hydrolase 40 isoform X2 [Anguilla anguilla]|uniref:ubiquitin carboxyl-terminal hydrolase 40 isoform X2 n=1 Tax=Anguilla anguilla TaxID=7936 RepID=UPI0015B2F9D1|nr:ubiquitin carboxyl-terminal hydrolase 40 isoform X2 [Anguilla anguilla]